MDVDPEQSGRRRRATRLGLALALILLVAAVWAPALDNGFVNWDDDLYVTANPRVHAGLDVRGLGWALTAFHGGNWHPLTWMSHMLDVELAGLEPRAHHRTNVLLHAANTLLLYLGLARLTGRAWPAAAVAALFAVHPLQVEPVAWVAERKTVLCMFWTLLALGAHAAWTRRRSTLCYVAVIVCTIAALAAKPIAVILPGLLLLADLWPLGRLDRSTLGKRVVEKLPVAALAAASAFITLAAQRAGDAVGTLERFPPAGRLANAAVASVVYLRKVFLPVDMAVFYPYPAAPLTTPRVGGAVVLLVLLTVLALRAVRDRAAWTVGWLAFLLALAPVIGLVQVGEQGLADRYAYFALPGLLVALVWGLGDLARRTAPSAVVPKVVLALVLLSATAAAGLATRAGLAIWRDSISLFEHSRRVTGDNLTVRLNLGNARLARGELEQAREELEAALRLDPDSAKAHYNLGVTLWRMNRPAEARKRYERALALRPDYVAARYNLGVLDAGEGRIDAAVRAFEEVLRLDADHFAACYNAGTMLAGAGRYAAALGWLERAVALRPDDAQAWFNLGVARWLSGDPDGAHDPLERARRLGFEPSPETRRDLEQRGVDLRPAGRTRGSSVDRGPAATESP